MVSGLVIRFGLIVAIAGAGVLRADTATTPADRTEAAKAMVEEGAGCFRRGELGNALAKYGEALGIFEQVHNKQDHPDTAACLGYIGGCLQTMGKMEDAIATFERTLVMWKRISQGQDDPRLAACLGNFAICLRAAKRYDEALEKSEQSRLMNQRIYKDLDSGNRAIATYTSASCFRAMGKMNDALPLFQECLAMRRRLTRNQDNLELAQTLNETSACLRAVGRAAEALPLGEESLAMQRRIFKNQDRREVASGMFEVAASLKMLGRHEEALAMLEDMTAIYRRLDKDKPGSDLPMGINHIGSCLMNMGRYGEAMPKFEEALALQKQLYQGRDHPDIVSTNSRISFCLNRLGRINEGLQRAEEMIAMCRRIYKGDSAELAAQLSNFGWALINMSRAPEALAPFEEALAMRRRIFHGEINSELASSLGDVSSCLQALNRHAEALPLAEENLAMQRRLYKTDDREGIAASLFSIASCLNTLGRREEALAKYEQSVAISQRMGDAGSMWHARFLGDNYLEFNQPEKAAKAYELTIHAFEELRQRVGGDDQDRMTYFSTLMTRWDPFSRMAVAQIKLGNPSKAMEYIERGRTRSLQDLLERGQRLAGGDVLLPAEKMAQSRNDSTAHEQIKQARSAMQDAEARVNRLTAETNLLRSRNDPADARKIESVQKELADAREAGGSARRAAYNLAGDTIAADFKPVAMSQIHQMLSEKQRMLYYSISDDSVLLNVIRPNGQKSHYEQLLWRNGTKVNRDNLARAVDATIAALMVEGKKSRGLEYAPTTRPGTTSEGVELFNALVPKEVWKDLQGAELVYVVPDGCLHRLPFEALMIQGAGADDAKGQSTYWVDEGPPIVYGSSAAMLLNRIRVGKAQRESKQTPRCQMVALGDPLFNRATAKEETQTASAVLRAGQLERFGTLSPLPGTRQEVLSVYKSITGADYDATAPAAGALVLLGEDATRPKLFEAVAGARYLHLATHGLSEQGSQAIYSSVALTQPRVASAADSGFLTLGDLLDNWWGKLNQTELVVLSACDSQGAKNVSTGEGAYGLPWGFMYAGAPAVIASLWPVDDAATAQMMGNFYKQIQDREGKPQAKLQALQAVRKELKRQHPQPYFWAPFIYTGDPG